MESLHPLQQNALQKQLIIATGYMHLCVAVPINSQTSIFDGINAIVVCMFEIPAHCNKNNRSSVQF